MIRSFKASGNVTPSRFVKLSSTDNVVAQAGAGEAIIGVSQAGTRNAPYSSLDDGYAAADGEDLEVFGDNEVCWLELGAAATVGARLKSDANGAGTPVTANNDEWGAVALVAGASGDLIQVEVRPLMQYGA